MDEKSENLLKMAFNRFKLSARGATRIIKIARTIADLNGHADIVSSDVAEAIQYRTRGLQE